MEDLLDDRCGIVVGKQVFVDELHGLDEIAGQGDLQLLEAAGAELLAEPDDAAFAGIGGFGHFGDRHMDDIGRTACNEIGNAARLGRKPRQHRLQPCEHSFEMSVFRTCDRHLCLP